MAEPGKTRKVTALYCEKRRKGTSKKTGIPYDTVDRRIAIWINADPAAGAAPTMLLHPREARKALSTMDADVQSEVQKALGKVPTATRAGFDLAQWTVAQ